MSAFNSVFEGDWRGGGGEGTNLVEEEDDGRSDKPSRIADGVKHCYYKGGAKEGAKISSQHPMSLVERERSKRRTTEKEGKRTRQTLLHPICPRVLVERLVILANRHKKHDCCDILKAVDPLFPLGPLTSNVEELVGEVTDSESRLRDTGRFDSGAEDILVRREVGGGGDVVHVVKVAAMRKGWTTPNRFVSVTHSLESVYKEL